MPYCIFLWCQRYLTAYCCGARDTLLHAYSCGVGDTILHILVVPEIPYCIFLWCRRYLTAYSILVVPEMPLLIVDRGCQVYMCDLSTHHLVISAHQFTYVKPTLLQCKHPVVYTNTMLYHGWIYELKTPWMCKWLATVWIGLWIQTKNSIFFFFKRDTPI